MAFRKESLCNLKCLLNDRKQAYFVDLFVRVSNTVAINMYKNLGTRQTLIFKNSLHYFININFFFSGYIIYRTVLEYYSGSPDEDAYGTIFFILKKKLKFKFYFISNSTSIFLLKPFVHVI